MNQIQKCKFSKKTNTFSSKLGDPYLYGMISYIFMYTSVIKVLLMVVQFSNFSNVKY